MDKRIIDLVKVAAEIPPKRGFAGNVLRDAKGLIRDLKDAPKRNARSEKAAYNYHRHGLVNKALRDGDVYKAHDRATENRLMRYGEPIKSAKRGALKTVQRKSMVDVKVGDTLDDTAEAVVAKKVRDAMVPVRVNRKVEERKAKK